MNFKEWCTERKRLANEFRRVFHFDVPYDETKLFIDIIKLDEMLNVPEDKSLADVIVEKYGQAADDIVEEMINLIDSFPEETFEGKKEQPKGLLAIAEKVNR